MPIVNLQPHLANEIGIDAEVKVSFDQTEVTLEEFLDFVFADNRLFRYSITDETKAIRRHINIFVDGKTTKDLNSTVFADSEIYIFQALSGG